ncbi:unnamed protein product [Auanema sp. JU1783]|nr:unnamed protein product [Auanema sp. JU1783]
MKWKEEQEKAKERASELRRFWLKKKEDQRTAQREKDFQDAVEKIRRAGYRGKFGEYEVPVEVRMKLDALKLQAEIGDHIESEKQPCVDEWKKLLGMNKTDSQRAYIKLANKVLTKYGWNPPTTWT